MTRLLDRSAIVPTSIVSLALLLVVSSASAAPTTPPYTSASSATDADPLPPLWLPGGILQLIDRMQAGSATVVEPSTPPDRAGRTPIARTPAPEAPVMRTPAPRAPIATPAPRTHVAVLPKVKKPVATRIVIRAKRIDLPVISGARIVPGQGPGRYPACDVAMWHTSFGQPGQPLTTYLYAHARAGMFLPLLTASERNNGKALLGALVKVYTSDARVHRYRITRVKRHATGFALVDNAPRGTQQLILQTSEGPSGTIPKLQVLAKPIGVRNSTVAEARPRAYPRPCYGE
jgi:hypothetical protein